MNFREDTLIETRDLHKTYITPAQKVPVLRGINLKIYRNEIVSIVGKSGVGKTTLLNILGLLDTASEGKLYIRDQEVTNLNNLEFCLFRNRHIGFVFQFYHLLPDFSALENVMSAGMIHHSFMGWHFKYKKIYRQRARTLLKMVGLAHRLGHYPYQLSGGERQRVAIARALVNDPDLVLLDEPTGNLDGKTSREIHRLLWRLQADLEKTFVIVTHEESLAARADRIIRMVDGEIIPVEATPSPKEELLAES